MVLLHRLAVRLRPPATIAGTAVMVASATVVALRNHVPSRASAARDGKRAASIRPRRSRSSSDENSSKITITTGVAAGTGGASTAAALLPHARGRAREPKGPDEDDHGHR